MGGRTVRTVLVAGVLAAGVWLWLGGPPGPDPTPRIFTARRILTLEPERPTAEAVAVADGRIVAVGSLAEVQAAVAPEVFALDERFAGKTILPGFVDPHVHPALGATILPMEIVSAMSWTTPAGRTGAVRGREAFLERLRELDRARRDAGDRDGWLLVWGHHAPYHGEISRADLDAVAPERPLLVWQRSVHEMWLSTRALEALGMTEATFDASDQADWETGHVFEGAMFTVGRPATRKIASPASYLRGLSMLSEVLHRGGLTTVGEQGFPQISKLGELATLHLEMRKGAPLRFVLVPNAMYLLRANEGDAAAAEREAEGLLRWSSDRVRFVRHAKYYADGAIYSQLMQMSEPYLDGHHGEWLMPPEDQDAVLDAFWDADWDLHVHVNGDAGLDRVLDAIEARERARPAPGRRIVLEHYGFARDDQHARVAALGVAVSNNAYYVYELAPVYAEHGLGPERAARISPLGGLEREGVRTSFHSDYPMAPAEPLRLVEIAVTRVASDGR
ncbi:MAG TPA: amidohydrolase family protein, partial [Myxococcota bacterium]|nr:amidohydrolase family protein [Myxococcota bacterium]